MKLRKAQYSVKPISHREAARFIEAHHYAKGMSNTRTFAFGLFQKEFSELLGVSVWIPPTKIAALSVYKDFTKVLALTRLAVHPSAPKNACTFLLAQSRKQIKKDGRFACLLTFADTYRNHTGGIYRADNWEYLGLTKPSPVYLDADGRMMGRKRGGKTLRASEMVELGFKSVGSFPKHKFRFLLTK